MMRQGATAAFLVIILVSLGVMSAAASETPSTTTIPTATRSTSWSVQANNPGLNFREDFDDIFTNEKDNIMIFIAAQGDITAVDSTSGTTLWSVPNPNGKLPGYQGFQKLVVSEASVFAAGANGLYAFDRKTGYPVWTWCKNNLVVPPAVANGVVFANCFNSNFSVVAINETYGTNIWNGTSPSAWTGKVFGVKGAVIAGFQNAVLVVPTTLGVISYDIATGVINAFSTIPTLSLNIVEACEAGFAPSTWHVVYCTMFRGESTHDWGYYAFNATSGALIWEKTIASQGFPFLHRPQPTPCGFVIMTSANRSVWALDGLTGSIKWSLDANKLGTGQFRPGFMTHFTEQLIFSFYKSTNGPATATGGFIGVECVRGKPTWQLNVPALSLAMSMYSIPTVHGNNITAYASATFSAQTSVVVSVPLFPLPSN